MFAIAWIPSLNCEGAVMQQMAHGAKIQYIEPVGYHTVTEYFDIDDYVILVDIDDETEGDN